MKSEKSEALSINYDFVKQKKWESITNCWNLHAALWLVHPSTFASNSDKIVFTMNPVAEDYWVIRRVIKNEMIDFGFDWFRSEGIS